MRFFLKLFLACALAVGAADASTRSLKERNSPLLGSWIVDVSRLPIPPVARPKSVTISFASVADDKWTMRVDIADGSGQEIDATGTYTLDGTQVAVTGSPEADAGAAKMPTPDVFILALSKGGAGASTRIYSAAPDGKNMVESAVYFSKDGKAIMRTNYFSSVR